MEAAAAESGFACAVAEKLVCQLSPYDPDKNIRNVDANNHLSASSLIMVSSVY